jgi:hypothetical protein
VLEVLEGIGTAESRKVLQSLAKGADGTRLTRAARKALERVDKRRGSGMTER